MTTISVSEEIWRWLAQQKDPGDSFDDVLRDMRENLKNQEQPPSVDVAAIAASEGFDAAERAALEEIVLMLQRRYPGWTEKSELLELAEDHPPGWDSSDDWWWQTFVTKALVPAGVVQRNKQKALIRLEDT